MEAYEKLKSLVMGIDDDLKKATGGNKAAGVRVRTVMQEVKEAAQELRQAMLELRDVENKPKA